MTSSRFCSSAVEESLICFLSSGFSVARFMFATACPALIAELSRAKCSFSKRTKVDCNVLKRSFSLRISMVSSILAVTSFRCSCFSLLLSPSSLRVASSSDITAGSRPLMRAHTAVPKLINASLSCREPSQSTVPSSRTYILDPPSKDSSRLGISMLICGKEIENGSSSISPPSFFIVSIRAYLVFKIRLNRSLRISSVYTKLATLFFTGTPVILSISQTSREFGSHPISIILRLSLESKLSKSTVRFCRLGLSAV
mmetsp:Transcript_7152/g.10443  ORF Transcript_7152/g.10443 Transcript_7152/m.10443 type:complete len:256 (-) Transcript_7152:500-1267(-)